MQAEVSAVEEPMAAAVELSERSARSPSVGGNNPSEPPAFPERAWVFLHRDHFPRRQSIKIVANPLFDKMVLILILCNCLTMALFANPVLHKLISARPAGWPSVPSEGEWVYGRWDLGFHRKDYCTPLGTSFVCSIADWIDLGFLVVFAIEMVLKLLAFGLIMHPNAYLRSSWNWLDFVVVVTGIIELVFPNLPGTNNLRLIKMLRPLRSINRVRGMRVLVQTILKAGPQICNVLVFLLFFLIIFALFGVSFFRGNLRHTCHVFDGGGWVSTGITCDAECEWHTETLKLVNCSSLGPDTKQLESYAMPWRWTYSCRPGQQCRCRRSGEANPACSFTDNPNYGVTHFDSLPWAMVSLFQAITLEGWVDQMYDLMDGCSVWVVIYYVLLVMVGAIVILNLFLAVLCNSLLESNDDVELTPDDEADPDAGEEGVERLIKNMRHTNVIRQKCLELILWKPFDYFIQGCILVNTVVMAAKFSPRAVHPLTSSMEFVKQWDYMPEGYFQFLSISNMVLTFIFACESVIKITAMGPRTFRKDRMNMFDLFVVVFSVLEIVLDMLERYGGTENNFPLPLSVLRAVRIFRLFKLVNSIESMRKIIMTLLQSIDAVLYLAGLMGLAILIFILLGMELFGGFYPQANWNYTRELYPDVFETNNITWDTDDEWASRYNFDDFGTALLTIFVVLSGENWNEIMWDSHRATWDSGGFPWAVPYFIVLFVIGNLLLFNLFIAILLSNFGIEEETEPDEEESPTSDFTSCTTEACSASADDAVSSTANGGNDGADSRRASCPAAEASEKRRPGISFHTGGTYKKTASTPALMALVANVSAASAAPAPAPAPASSAHAAPVEAQASAGNLSDISVPTSGDSGKRSRNKKPAPELVYEFGAFRDPNGEKVQIRKGRGGGSTGMAATPATPEEKRMNRTSIRFDSADLGQPWADVHVVLTAADVGMTLVIDGSELRVNGWARGVHWGDARPPEGESARGVIQSVEDGVKGLVTLADGTTFENPWTVYLALFTQSDVGRQVEIDHGDVRLDGVSHMALWGDGPGSVAKPRAAEVSGEIRAVEERVGGRVTIESDVPGVGRITVGNPRDGAIQYPPYPSWLDEGELETGGDKSCFVFGWENPLRRACCKVILHPLFEVCVIVLILVSTGCLMVDLPHLRASHPLKQTLYRLNIFFFVIFFLEACSKVIATGFIRSKTPKHYPEVATPYLRDPWNVLDAFIVLVSFITLFPTPGLEGFRALRALRPLRLASRVEDLKLTVDTLLKSIPAMGSLILVSLLFFIIFGILGLELFGGKLGYCMDPHYADLPYGSRVVPGMNGAQTDYEECMALSRYNLTRRTTDGILLTDMADLYPVPVEGVPGSGTFLEFTEFPQWLYPQFGTFDNIAYSLLLLFEVSALEGWPDVMHTAMDTDADHMLIVPWQFNHFESPTPLHKHKPTAYLAGAFFVVWITIGCFVVVNMTIGVVVDTFAHIKQTNDGVILMSVSQQEWVRTQKQAFSMRPLKKTLEPQEPWRKRAHAIVTGDRFEVVIMSVILLNMLQMGTDWWEPYANSPYQPDLKNAHKYINVVFFTIYVGEMLLKWVGLGFYTYFNDAWNDFDFILVCISTFDVITAFAATEAGTAFPPSLFRMLRLVRVLRILRIIKSAKNMRTLVMTVFISLPQLYNIMALIMLLVIIFDMMCVNIFFAVNYTPGTFDLSANKSFSEGRGEVYDPNDYHYSDDGTNWGDGINRHANFQYFWTGMLTLSRSATGESFNGIMHDLYGYDWGHNRLTCCLQCGPIIDGANVAATDLTVPSTGQLIKGRITPEDSCGASFGAFTIYFFFQIIMAYIVLSIMIGVILENFNSIGSPNQNVSIDDIENFRQVWLKYDPAGTYRTAAHNIIAIISQLETPLGVKNLVPAPTRSALLREVQRLNLPDHNGQIHFNETLTHLSKMAQERAQDGEIRLPDVDAVRKIARLSEHIPGLKTLDGAQHNTYTNYVLALLQARFRDYRERMERRESEAIQIAEKSTREKSRRYTSPKVVGAASAAATKAASLASRSVGAAKAAANAAMSLSRESSNSSNSDPVGVVVMALAEPDVPAVVTVKGVALVRARNSSAAAPSQ